MKLDSLQRQQLAKKIIQDIDEYCRITYDDGHRKHLGASIIGHACARYIYYTFRWAKKENFDGRMLRLFNRGQLEEKRWIEWLEGIGFKVWEIDPNTNKQFRIYGAGGHFGGSLDGVGITPYADYPGPFLLEFKTYSTKTYTTLIQEGVKKFRPQHYRQMCAYGKEYGFNYGIYFPINKNDDNIEGIEVVDLDWSEADDLEMKAVDIINSKEPPQKISHQPSYYECKYCNFQGICHHDHLPEKNCRSCILSEPVVNGNWFCKKWHSQIPENVIPNGCDEWEPIK